MDILITKNKMQILAGINNNLVYQRPNTLRLDDVINIIQTDKYNDLYKQVLPYKNFKRTIEADGNSNLGIHKMNKVFYEVFIRLNSIQHYMFIPLYLAHHPIIQCGVEVPYTGPPNPQTVYRFLEGHKNSRFFYNELVGKLLRAYMSFLKEIYVLYWLLEKGFDVTYSLMFDINDGCDIVVKHNNSTYGIRIYSDTKKANQFADTKIKSRHKVPQDWTVIDLPTNLCSYTIGDTYVYSDDVLNKVAQHILHNNKYDIKIF